MRICLFFVSLTYLCASLTYAISYNEMFLPENFIIYTNGKVATREPNPNFRKVILPTINDNTKNPGCYIACYSQDATYAVYQTSANSYIIGQIRVEGVYNSRYCVPLGTVRQDISQMMVFRTLCTKFFPTACKGNRCWADPDTGGWLGITTGISN